MDFTDFSFRHLLDVAVWMKREAVPSPVVEGDTRLRKTESEIAGCTILDLLHVSPHKENTEVQPRAEDECERQHHPPIHTSHKEPPDLII
jgi:hypothetical protein